ncbi:MAG: alpha/beta hydrolase [Hyphomicrobiales bacterium]|nr:MAG: alpha/beta hydrolase [Hyphomicrobiales bacterium]
MGVVMVSREARVEIDRLFAERKPDRPLEQRRREWEAEARLAVLPREARFTSETAGGVKCEWMEMPRVARDRVFLFFHGGGYNAGSPRTHRPLAANLSRATHMRLLLPDYRLAPENPFPAGVKDALLVYQWLLNQGYSEDNILVGGDSAGGGLTLSMLLALRAAGARMPKAAILLAPWTDLTASSGSYQKLRKFDPIITHEGLREAGLMYAGKRDPADPLLSPLFADPTGLPPMLIHVGGDEVMLDDSRRFAERATAAGVPVTYKLFDGMWHVFHTAGQAVPEARLAIEEIGGFVRALYAEVETV